MNQHDLVPGDLIHIRNGRFCPRLELCVSGDNSRLAGMLMWSNETFGLVVSSFYQCGCLNRDGVHLILAGDVLGWTFGEELGRVGRMPDLVSRGVTERDCQG